MMQDTQGYFFSEAEIQKALDFQPEHVIIGLCGPSGVGKDTAGVMLGQKLNFWHEDAMVPANMIGEGYAISFARTLKSMCAGFSCEDMTAVWETHALEITNYSDPAVKNQPAFFGRTRKEFAQFVGTDLFRKFVHPNIWVACLANQIKIISDDVPKPVFIITDVRFQNEVDWILSKGGIILNIHRDVPTRGIPGHISDSGIQGIIFNNDNPEATYEIDNNGTLAELDDQLKYIVGVLKERGFKPYL